MMTSIHRDICSGLALIIMLLISISVLVCQELPKKLCEGWTRCKGRTCSQAWTAAKAGPFARRLITHTSALIPDSGSGSVNIIL